MADDSYRDGLQEDNGMDSVDGAYVPRPFQSRGMTGGSADGCSYDSALFSADSGIGNSYRLNLNDNESERRGGASQGGRGYGSNDDQSASIATNPGVDACAETIDNLRLDSGNHSYDDGYQTLSLTLSHNENNNNYTDLPPINITPRVPTPESYIDEDGDSQLHLAVSQRREDVVGELLGSRLPPGYVNYKDAHGRTALHLAVLTDQPELFKVLLENSADPSARDLCGDTPLHMACRDNLLNCVKTLVTLITFLYPASQIEPNSRNYQGFTCLHLAAANGNRDVTSFLINHFNAEINAGDGCSGRTVLHHAADRGDRNFVYFLLNEFQSKLNVDAVAHDKRTTPLMLARGREHTDIVEVLAMGGAKRVSEYDFYSESETDSETDMSC